MTFSETKETWRLALSGGLVRLRASSMGSSLTDVVVQERDVSTDEKDNDHHEQQGKVGNGPDKRFAEPLRLVNVLGHAVEADLGLLARLEVDAFAELRVVPLR